MSVSTIRTDKNLPLITIDGKEIPTMLFALSDFPAAASNTVYAAKNIAGFAKAGITAVCIDTELRIGWHKIEPFDPSALIAEISNVLDVNPNAKVMIRMHTNAPYWWIRDNPDECTVFRTPNGDVEGNDDGEQDRLIRDDGGKFRARVSIASEKWLDDASEMLAAFCDAVRGTKEGDAILGIQPACGVNGEWHQWGTDVSAPMRRRFVRFLHEKYQTVEKLRAAWHNDTVTFETAEFRPDPFREADDGEFRDPKLSRDTMDSQECIQMTPPDAILRFCKVVKEHLPNVLTGTFYGYYLGTSKNIGGHLKVERLYQAREEGLIDFMSGPFCYFTENRSPVGVPLQRGLLESSRLRGMIWLTEMDQHPMCVARLGGDISKKDETISVLRRNVLQPLAAGEGLWFYDHRVIPKFVKEHPELKDAASLYRKTGWWEDDYLMKEIEQLKQLADRCIETGYESVADVLLVYDCDSYYCRREGYDPDYALNEAIARSGVVYDTIYANELPIADLDRYKCVIMANCCLLTPEKREQYRRLLAGKKTVWLWAQGFCDGDSLSEENLSQTVGIHVRRAGKISSFIGEGILNGVVCRVPSVRPQFTVDDTAAEVIARFDDGSPAAAIKGSDIWIALPVLSRELIEPIFRSCGVHIWCESGDPIIACNHFAAINCPAGGHRELRLPDGRTVVLDLKPFTTEIIEL